MVNPDAFGIVLEYLYTKDLSVIGPRIPLNLLIDTWSLASQYIVEPLMCKLEAMITYIKEESETSETSEWSILYEKDGGFYLLLHRITNSFQSTITQRVLK